MPGPQAKCSREGKSVVFACLHVRKDQGRYTKHKHIGVISELYVVIRTLAF